MPAADSRRWAFSHAPRHVLVVDDDPGIRDVLAQALIGAGYRVSCAADGEAGWDALCADSVDVLITDNDMPLMRGVDLLRRVRAGPLQLPVVFISGQMPSHESDFFRWLPPGVALAKPFALSAVVESVRDLLAFAPCCDRDHGSQPGSLSTPQIPAELRLQAS